MDTTPPGSRSRTRNKPADLRLLRDSRGVPFDDTSELDESEALETGDGSGDPEAPEDPMAPEAARRQLDRALARLEEGAMTEEDLRVAREEAIEALTLLRPSSRDREELKHYRELELRFDQLSEAAARAASGREPESGQ